MIRFEEPMIIIQDAFHHWKEKKKIENWKEGESKFATRTEEEKKIEETHQSGVTEID